MTRSDIVGMVCDFHRRFRRPIRTAPQLLDQGEYIERLEYMLEEVMEFKRAHSELRSVEECADALGDLIYFAIGTGIQMGIDLRPVLVEIHRSNMTKTPKEPEFKHCVKGPNYEPPDIASALAAGDLL